MLKRRPCLKADKVSSITMKKCPIEKLTHKLLKNVPQNQTKKIFRNSGMERSVGNL